MSKILSILIFLGATPVFAHEQWFFTKNEMAALNHQPIPAIFTEVGFFNTIIVVCAIIFSIVWVISANSVSLPKSIVKTRIEWSAFILRLMTGGMLLLSSIGLLPAFDINFLIPTLFAPDLIIPTSLLWLKWVETILSFLLIIGYKTRLIAFTLIILLCFSLHLFGQDMLQFSGFYLGIFLFLCLQGGGKFSLHAKNSKFFSSTFSIIILQMLTGLNFIYSAITIKFFKPNMDIALLAKKEAITFGLSYAHFTFLMFVVEITMGILFMVGARLHVLSFLLLLLFTFLSWNVSENIFLHLFIYGILFSFILLRGVNIFPKRSLMKARYK